MKLAANALATTLYLLALHKVQYLRIIYYVLFCHYNHLYSLVFIYKDVQKKVRDEILHVLGDDLTPSMEQQNELKYMNMVIKENLRLYPPVCIT